MAQQSRGSRPKQKRADLQAIRGIAIMSVLLFHFFPKWFPNGYVGVDQFFVLSGYLIAMILSSSDLSLSTITSFYYRRVKRIVPLYSFVILLLLIALFTVFPASNIDLNVTSARFALSFMTNLMRTSPDKAYAVMLSLAVDAFTHTWSLAVEMQFYLLVPFIFYVSSGFRMHIIMITGIASFAFSMLSDENTAFNSVFARLWQFCVGIGSCLIAHALDQTAKFDKEVLMGDELGSDEELPHTRRDSKTISALISCFTYLLLGFALFQQLYDVPVPATLLRVNITILTGCLIVLGSKETISIMSSRVLVYFGDISYTLYLVHWPIYTYVKFTYDQDVKVLCTAMAASVVIAAIITETYEKIYLRQGKLVIFILIAVQYATCVVLIQNSSRISQHLENKSNVTDYTKAITKDEAVQLNWKWFNNDQGQLYDFPCVKHKNYTGCTFVHNTTVAGPSIMILGNSYSANSAGIVTDSCFPKALKISMYWFNTCETLIATNPTWCGPNVTDSYIDIVRSEKPDILFLLSRHLEMMKPLKVNEITKNLKRSDLITQDTLYHEAVGRLWKYEQLIPKQIYVLNAMPRPIPRVVQTIISGLQDGKPPMMATLTDSANYLVARDRLEAVVKRCKKCKMIDYTPYLTINNEFQFYLKSYGLSYFTGGLHLTPLGLNKVKPVYEEICSAL